MAIRAGWGCPRVKLSPPPLFFGYEGEKIPEETPNDRITQYQREAPGEFASPPKFVPNTSK